MLKAESIRYRTATQTPDFHFPDSVVDAFAAPARAVAGRNAPPLPDDARRFSLAEAKSLIVAAMQDFDPALGRRTEELFRSANYRSGAADAAAEEKFRGTSRTDYSPRTGPNPYTDDAYTLPALTEGLRWNISPVGPGQSRLMRSLPAQSERSWLGPPNPHNHAVIEFEFDGTIDGVVHMAHEAGHALADASRHTAPVHMQETQAYLTQNILYGYLGRHPDASIRSAAQAHAAHTIAENSRAVVAGLDAVGTVPAGPEHANALQGDIERMHHRGVSFLSARMMVERTAVSRRGAMVSSVMGENGPRDITAALSSIGIEFPHQMEEAAKMAGFAPSQRLSPSPTASPRAAR